MHWVWTFAIFWRGIGASLSVGLFEPIPWKSVTLAFERMIAEALGWYDNFGRGLIIALPRPGLNVGLLGLL
jgi:hypothetical protein